MIDRLSTAASLAVRHAGAYVDLIQSDLDLSSRVLRARVIAALSVALALQLAVALGCVWIIAAAWDTSFRIPAIASLLGVFLLVAGAAWWKFRALSASAPPVLSQTISEWAKDRRLLEELLAARGPRAEAP
jgi:uncharacterized membrane protein YqjE